MLEMQISKTRRAARIAREQERERAIDEFVTNVSLFDALDDARDLDTFARSFSTFNRAMSE